MALYPIFLHFISVMTILVIRESYSVNRFELAKCIANPSCAANVTCLQTCNNRPDETECQVNSEFFIVEVAAVICLPRFYHGS